MAKQQTWTKLRHRVVTCIVRPFLTVWIWAKYHIKLDKFRQQGDRNWLILSNHQTDFDQFFLGMAFRKPLYYVALDDLFSNGWVSRLVEWLVAPIPIMKAQTDFAAVRICAQVAKEGGNIALFPEGNRTYSGRTCYIKPGITTMAKVLNLPIAIFRIEGGYGIKPRWADDCRKGKMHAGVIRVIEPEEYKTLSKDEMYDLICRELYVDESQDVHEFKSKRLAEGLERVLYVCPECGISDFETKGDAITCKRCGLTHRYMPDKLFINPNGKAAFSNVGEWYDYQEAFIRSMPLSESDKPIFEDTADLKDVIVLKKKVMHMEGAKVRAYHDHIIFEKNGETLALLYSEIRAMSCTGGHKLGIYHRDKAYLVKGDTHFNALKYVNLYYHAKFMTEAHKDGEFQFLGL